MKRFLIVLLILSISNVFAQKNKRKLILRYEIQDKLIPIIGDSSEVNEVIEIDSAKVDEYTKDDFTDPYGTLTGCTIFSVRPKGDPEEFMYNLSGAYWFGVYKDGEVLWLSDSLYSDETLDSYFIVTQDINKDGKVDIVNELSTFDLHGGDLEEYLFIISWDGQNGEFINDGGKHSKITNYKGGFKLIDLNDDGVYELSSDTWTYDETTNEYDSSKVVACWNGEKYGIWDNCPQWPVRDVNRYYPFTQANNIKFNINSVVKKNNDGENEYKYILKNMANSSQKIYFFYFTPFIDTFYVRESDGWKKTGGFLQPLYGFKVGKFATGILPDSLKRFVCYTKNNSYLPKLSRCYVQGNYQYLRRNVDLKEMLDALTRNVFSNSAKSYILLPASPPNPFIPIEFIDTLIAYTDSSYALGWIKNEQTRDKYNNYFTNAKNYLNQNNNNAAKTELQKVLTDCNTDSSTVLTSEAYALLYFNTEYLIKKLKQRKSGLPAKQKNNNNKKATIKMGDKECVN